MSTEITRPRTEKKNSPINVITLFDVVKVFILSFLLAALLASTGCERKNSRYLHNIVKPGNALSTRLSDSIWAVPFRISNHGTKGVWHVSFSSSSDARSSNVNLVIPPGGDFNGIGFEVTVSSNENTNGPALIEVNRRFASEKEINLVMEEIGRIGTIDR